MSNIGALGVVGIAPETTFGTGVDPSDFIPFTSEGFKDGPETIQESQIRALLDQAPKYKGMQAVTGTLSGVAYPGILGILLRAALGSPTDSGAGPYVHTYTPIQSAFSSDAALPSYSIVVKRGPQLVRYLGMVCSGLTLKFTQGGLVTFDTNWIGQDVDTPSSPTVTLPSDAPFQMTAALTRGGAAEASLQDYSLAINNTLEALKLINNTSKIARIAWSGIRTIAITGTADFAATDLYDQFKLFSGQAWVIDHTQGTDELQVTLPAGLVTDAGAAIGGEGRITLSFTSDGMYDTVTSKALEIALTNSVASY